MTDVSAWLGLAGIPVAAILAFVFGRLQLGRANELQREEDLRRRRVDVYANFCSAAVEYRSAQLHRWHEDRLVGASRRQSDGIYEVAQAARTRRAAAWGEYYKVLMICNDERVADLARDTLRQARRMKFSRSAEEIDRRSNEVHQAINQFARVAGATITTSSRQKELAPPQRSTFAQGEDGE